MALAFQDPFNRADGILGSDWQTYSGSPTIESYQAKLGAQVFCGPTRDPDSANQCQRLSVTAPTVFAKSVYLRFRVNSNRTTYYQAMFTFNATTITVTWSRVLAGASVNICTETIVYTYGAAVEVMASVSGGNLYAWVDSVLWLQGYNTEIVDTGHLEMGSGANYVYVDQYWFYDFTAVGFTLELDEQQNNPGHWTVTLHNAGADWTPGTPGSPEFVPSNGILTDQTVVDTDTATATWEPGDILSGETILDPQNEHYFQFDVTFPAGAVGPPTSGTGLTSNEHTTLEHLQEWFDDYSGQADQINRTLYMQMGSLVLAMSYGQGTPGDMLQDSILAILDQTEGLGAIYQTVHSTWDRLDWLTDYGDLDLNTVQNNIRGANLPSIADVLTAISALSSGTDTDLTEVLLQLSQIRTANLWTLGHVKDWIEAIPPGSNQDVLQELAVIRTANFWTLGHIMDAIAAIDVPDYGPSLTDIHDHVAAIPTNPVTSLQPALDAISLHNTNLNSKAADILAAIALRPTNPVTSLQPVLDAISTLTNYVDSRCDAIDAAIAALEVGTGSQGAPVWPGLANVTFGAPVAIDRTFSSSDDCDGVLVAITSNPNPRSRYDWGSVVQQARAGYVCFQSDNGAMEDPQPFTFPSHILTPVHVARASGFIGRAAEGVTGTVTPWSIVVA
ncbi:MAG TPA: hypothetical protein VIY48_22335 [Candidatus Paceibacterota bacterium]